MASFFRRPFSAFRLLLAVAKLVWRPAEVAPVLDMIDEQSDDPTLMAELVDALEAHPRTAAALRDQPQLAPLDMPRLRALPADTFGHAVADFVDRNGLDPAYFSRPPAQSREEYVSAHLGATHDLWHVATGIDNSIAGELGLQAFYLAQFPSQLPILLFATGFLNQLLFGGGTDEMRRRVAAVARGWQMGERAQPLFGVDWNEALDRPLAEVRAELGLVARAGDAEALYPTAQASTERHTMAAA